MRISDWSSDVCSSDLRGLKLLLDFVPNHSSDRHPWFVESRSSRDNPRRDWYIWRDPAPGGGPPNNWISDFGGRSEEHTSELQSLMRISYAVFCLKKKNIC